MLVLHCIVAGAHGAMGGDMGRGKVVDGNEWRVVRPGFMLKAGHDLPVLGGGLW